MRRIALILLALAAACSSDSARSDTPKPGTLAINLVAGGSNDGAMLLVVSGGPVTSVASPAGYDVATNADSAGTHVMVVGALTPGVLATIDVPDTRQLAAYVVTVEQVADRTTFGLLDPAAYQVTVTTR